jgi:GcrA cell cycle regulator
MPTDRDRPWTAEELADLRRLWDEGLTAGQIGERLRRTRNSILGKVHRLKLPSRASPLGKPADSASARPKAPKPPRAPKPAPLRAGATTLPPIALAAPPKPAPLPPGATTLPRIAAVAPPAPAPEPRLPAPRRGTCQWPIGEPRTDGFRFCGDPLWSGTRLPYCETHARYARPKPRDEDAA